MLGIATVQMCSSYWLQPPYRCAAATGYSHRTDVQQLLGIATVEMCNPTGYYKSYVLDLQYMKIVKCSDGRSLSEILLFKTLGGGLGCGREKIHCQLLR